MPKFGDRVKETTESTGTGTINLAGAPTGFRAFSDEFTSGDDEISYLIVDDPDNPTAYEYGKGTYTSGTPDTLSRDTVEGSSNSGAKVSFTAGTKTVIATPTSADFNVFGGDGPWASKSALVRAITSNDTQLAADDGKLILADGSGNSPAGLTYTLLAASSANDGYVVTVMNTGASGSTTIDGSGAETINGATTLVLTAQYQVATLRCDGTQWYTEGAQMLSQQGDLVAMGASYPERLALGADNGMVVGRNMSGALAYIYQGWEYVSTTTASNDATLDWTDLDENYDHLFVASKLKPDTDNASIWWRTSPDTGGSPTFDSTAADYHYYGLGGAASSSSVVSFGNHTSATAMLFGNAVGAVDASETGVTGEFLFLNPRDSSQVTTCLGLLFYMNTSANGSVVFGHGSSDAVEGTPAVRFMFSTGNVASGTMRHYRRRIQ